MQASDLDRSLDLHEIMLKSVDRSLKSTKKKLHKYELTLQNQPDFEKSSPKDFMEFDINLYTELKKSPPEKFPSLLHIKREFKRLNPHPIKLSTGKIVLSKEAKDKIEKDRLSRKISTRTLDALQELRKDKHFGKSKTFGTGKIGEVLRTVKIKDGYKEYSRNLIRQEPVYDEKNLLGKTTIDCEALEKSDKFSLPLFNPSIGSYQVAFKSPGRKNKNPHESSLHVNASMEFLTDSSGKDISPLRQRILSKTMDNSNINPFSSQSGLSSIGFKSPISTIRSPPQIKMHRLQGHQGHHNIDVKTHVLNDDEDSNEDNLDINEHNLSRHFGKYYSDETYKTVRTLIRKTSTFGNIVHKDFSLGALSLKSSLNRPFAFSEAYSTDDDSTVLSSSSNNLSKNDQEIKFPKHSHKKKLLSINSQNNLNNSVQDVNNNLNSKKFDPPKNLEDIGPTLRKWYEENKIYTPIRPKTTKYLKKQIPVTYMEIEKELILSPNYDGPKVDGEEVEILYNEFIRSKSESNIDIVFKEFVKQETDEINEDDFSTF